MIDQLNELFDYVRRDTIAHSAEMPGNSSGYDEIINFDEVTEYFVIDQVDIWIESGAGIDTKVRLTDDGNAIAPGTGWVAGGGDRLPLPVEAEVYKSTTLRTQYDNGDSNAYDYQFVIHGYWVGTEEQ